MILLMGGTTDARLLARELKLSLPDTDILATAVTSYGAKLLQGDGHCRVLTGAQNEKSLCEIIRREKIRLLVDATHPYAVRASAEAARAAASCDIPLLRFERPPTSRKTLGQNVLPAASPVEAATLAAGFGSTIFLTFGTRYLPEFMEHLPAGLRVVARVLPDEDSISRCRVCGLTAKDIVALQGPFSRRFNREMFRAYRASVVVSKDSGGPGGTQEKLEAAAGLGIPVVLIGRPSAGTGIGDPALLVKKAGEILKRT